MGGGDRREGRELCQTKAAATILSIGSILNEPRQRCNKHKAMFFVFFLTQRDRRCDVFCCAAAAPFVSGVLPVIIKNKKKGLLQFGNTIRQPNRTPSRLWLTNVLTKKKKEKKFG